MNDFYREEIIDHYRHPMNFGSLPDATVSSKISNPFCGDELELFIKLNSQSAVDIRFIGKGCALSIAGASILTEFIKGKSINALTKFSEKDMLDLLNIDVSETRKKCVLLGLEALKDCLAIKRT
ncbi:MAG TPA: iron-sulfur cluster assembly scaffold protein [Patescibacteria group bacterium]|nr:iron-sulfur cluster assembly scaffold protein [Patescibacteria group bacterium]